MLAMLGSDPASQYCSVRKYARMSCAVPGMKRSSFGSWRSIFISPLPPGLLPLRLPRSFLSHAMAPSASPLMSNLPTRVSFTTSLADMQPIITSQWSRRATRAGITARTWSSRNSMVAITMSPRAIAALQRISAASSVPHSSAAWTDNSSPGKSRRNSFCARAAASDRWLSMVTTTTRTGVASAGEVRFGIVKRLDGYGDNAVFIGEAFGVAARLAANEERNFVQLFFRVGGPDDGDPGRSHPRLDEVRRFGGGMPGAEM